MCTGAEVVGVNIVMHLKDQYVYVICDRRSSIWLFSEMTVVEYCDQDLCEADRWRGLAK